MLGVKKEATLDNTDEFNMLMEKTSMYVAAIVTCPLQLHEVWLGYQPVYKPCLQYPLFTMLFNDDQVAKLHVAIVPKILLWMGYWLMRWPIH
eukprot:683666-Ditylum_brightwellii.AAC.1